MSNAEDEIRDRYRELALEWASLRDDPKKANRVFKRHHAYYKEIRGLAEGQRALRALLSDPEVPVRLLAATHSLLFAAKDAEAVLTKLQDGGGIYAMDAKYTLIGFRTGKLNLDW
jgi:hypothetical protein